MPEQPSGTQIMNLRSRAWFDNPANVDMTALYLERTMNYGLTLDELQSGRPIIGIAQTGSDITPCNRHHLVLATRVRDGIREAGGIPFEFPIHPIQETCKRPTAMLDRNLQYLSLVEILYGYPIDGVVLTTGCDKTTPAQIMAAATVDIPAIVLSGGPMLNGWFNGERTGSGTILWRARELMARGEIDAREFTELVASSAPSAGHCNTMGTASTMNSLAEALGMSLPGCAAIPAPHRDRQEMAYLTGKRSVEIVREDLRPSQVLTRAAFENAIVVCSAIGGSTNAPIQLNAIARHVGVELDNDDWERIGYDVPLLVNMQPAGRVPRRGVLPRRRRAGRRRRADLARQDRPDRAHDQRQDAVREQRGAVHEGSRGDQGIRRADAEPRGLPQPEGQPLRQRDHEDVGDLGRVPAALSREPGRSECVRGPRDGLRRPGGLPRAHRRSGARTRRGHGARHSRRRADRLSGRSGGRQHALAGLSPEAWSAGAAVHRRRPPVGDVGQPVDPQRVARRRRLAAVSRCCRRATGCASTSASARPTSSSRTKSSRRAARRSSRPAATSIRRARRRGRRSSAASSTSSSHGMVLKPAVKYQRIAETKGLPRDNH